MKNCILFALFLCFSLPLFSQITLKGSVITDEEDPSGTLVMNATTNDFTITDMAGYYEVKGSIGDRLVFSHLGYESQEIEIKRLEDAAEIFMRGTSFNLPEVIILAMQPLLVTQCTWRCGGRVSSEEEVVQENKKKGKKKAESLFKPLIKAYPNPTLGRLTVDWPETSIFVEVFDMNGAQIQGYQLDGRKSINLSSYPAGTYILRCFDNNGQLIGSTPVIKVN